MVLTKKITIFAHYFKPTNTNIMRVKVNDKSIVLFRGASVRDALVRFFARCDIERSQITKATVYDQWGHEIDLDAPLNNGQEITFKWEKESCEE